MRALMLAVGVAAGLLGDTSSPSSSDVADATERLTGGRAHMGLDMRRLAGERLLGPAITMVASARVARVRPLGVTGLPGIGWGVGSRVKCRFRSLNLQPPTINRRSPPRD